MAELHKQLSSLTEQITERQSNVILLRENLDKAARAHEVERQVKTHTHTHTLSLALCSFLKNKQ